MNFFNRAIKNTTRRISKSLLLLITFFVIGNFVIVGLGVSQASEQAKTLTRQKMRAVVTYGIDHNAVNRYIQDLTDEDEINQFYDNYPRVTLEDIEKLLQDSRVKTANAMTFNNLYGVSGELDYVRLGNQAEENDANNGQSCFMGPDGVMECSAYVSPNFAMKGNFFPDMIEFIDGGYAIEDGRFYTQDEIDKGAKVGLISKALAEANGLRVGDTVRVYTNSPSEVNNYLSVYGVTIEDITLEFEIIGIFTHQSQITPDNENFDYTQPYDNPDNLIFMPATTMFNSTLVIEQKMFDYWATQNPEDEYYKPENRPSEENKDRMYIGDVTLLLNDPLEVDAFVEEYQGQVGEFKKLDANNEEFERLAKPLDTLSLYANFIVWLVVINAVIIITLVTALTLKTREYEIGVLLSVGASKLQIVAQFFVELAIVAILGFTLSIVSGSLIANKVGETVLDYQIQSSGLNEENEEDIWFQPGIWDTDYSTQVELDDLVAEYNVSVSPLIIAEIYVVGLGIVLISILIPSLMIMRFNPKRILMNQN